MAWTCSEAGRPEEAREPFGGRKRGFRERQEESEAHMWVGCRSGAQPSPARPSGRGRKAFAILSAATLGGLVSGCNAAGASTIGNPDRGAVIIGRASCGSCHEIPGIPLADGQVGPPLSRFGSRILIAGTIPNSPPNLVFWLQHPQQVRPGTTMPETGLSEAQARDVAAYLSELR